MKIIRRQGCECIKISMSPRVAVNQCATTPAALTPPQPKLLPCSSLSLNPPAPPLCLSDRSETLFISSSAQAFISVHFCCFVALVCCSFVMHLNAHTHIHIYILQRWSVHFSCFPIFSPIFSHFCLLNFFVCFISNCSAIFSHFSFPFFGFILFHFIFVSLFYLFYRCALQGLIFVGLFVSKRI